MIEYINELEDCAKKIQLHTVKTQAMPAELGKFCSQSCSAPGAQWDTGLDETDYIFICEVTTGNHAFKKNN